MADLVEALGNDPEEWFWSRLRTVTFHLPFGEQSALLGAVLDVGPLPIGGGIETVNPVPWSLTSPWESTYGASVRYIVDLARPERSLRVIPAGTSGNVMSPHYRDQVDLWMNGTYRPFLLSPEEVARDQRYVTRLVPP